MAVEFSNAEKNFINNAEGTTLTLEQLNGVADQIYRRNEMVRLVQAGYMNLLSAEVAVGAAVPDTAKHTAIKLAAYELYDDYTTWLSPEPPFARPV